MQALLDALQSSESLASIAPWAIAIACIAGIQSFVTAVQRERQEILGELMQRHVEDQVLEVATAVDLLGFETPAFHNRVQRMRLGGPQALNVMFGLSGLIRAVIGVVAVLVTLITIEPLLVLMVSIVFVPAWLSASRRGQAFWRFFWRMTPRDRERQYLASLLSDRDDAKEIRAFNLAQFLRARHRSLYDERIRVLLAGRTVLLISHRFSSVRHADRIYVLHSGRVIEEGTHEELMALGGHYAELFQLQAAAYLAGTPDAL